MTRPMFETCRSAVKNATSGYVLACIPGGLAMDETVFDIGANDDPVIARPGSRPLGDRDRTAMCDQRMDKVGHQGLNPFAPACIRDQWSQPVIKAIGAKPPEAFR